MLTSIKRPFKVLLIIVFFVYVDVICENVLIIINDQQPHFLATSLVLLFLIFEIFFAALQSGLSDFFGRRNSLIASFIVSTISLLFLLLYNFQFGFSIYFLIIALGIKSIWGNTIPMAFAAIVDTQKRDKRGAFALASSTYSLGFISLVLINFFFGKKILSESNFFHIIFAGIIILIALWINISKFKDASDRHTHFPEHTSIAETHNFFITFWKLSKKEIRSIIKEMKRPLTRTALLAYFLWEVSMYSIIISQIDLNPGPAQKITLIMMIGYLTGIFILKLKPCMRVKDFKMITTGYLFSFSSLIPYFLLFKYFHPNSLILIGSCYFLHAVGNAFLSPSVISIITTNRLVHEQGKILGLVESMDNLAFLVATLAVMFYATHKLPIVVLIAFSFISFSISWIFYPIIKKLDKAIDREKDIN